MDILDQRAKADVEQVIERNRERLVASRGFIAARPGFAISDGKLVREPAIIAYVERRLPPSVLDAGEALPEQLDGYRIDVVEPDPPTRQDLARTASTLAPDLPVAAAATPPTYQPIAGNPIDRDF